MALHTLQPDTMLREYRIIKLLGEGGFGLTYLAFDTHLEKQVAIKEYMPAEHAVRESDSKIVPRSSASEKTYKWGLNAFLNEAKTLAKFENPSIVRIYRFFKENGTAYIVMEYCQGGCLIDIISKDKPMDEQELKKIITSIVNGLQRVHKEGILHRDIKPDNIMFRSNGSAVLIDFGAARQAIGDQSRKVTTIITPGYAPLEQYSSKGKIGPWSDIYSLAAVAYLCITGEKPPDIMNRLHDDTIVKLSDRLNSSAFLKAIDYGLNLQVDERPQSLSEWSSLWEKTNDSSKSNRSTEIKNSIVAKKEISPETHHFKPQVITALPNISARDHTTINTHTIQQNQHTKGFGFFKGLFILLGLVVLTLLTIISYEHVINKIEWDQLLNADYFQKKWNLFMPQKPEKIPATTKPSKDKHTLHVQNMLNMLGYKVAQSGELDIRTQQSIKKFEQDNELVVTGIVDDILINELIHQIEIVEQQNWQEALKLDTENAYIAYSLKYPNNTHKKDIVNKINSLKKIKKEQLKILQEQQEKDSILNKENNQKQQLIAVTLEKKKLILAIQAQLIRLKYSDLNQTGNLDIQTKSLIKTYQKLKNLPVNGLPTKTLLFKLKSEKSWPGRKIGEMFKACKNCPQMVVIKSGSFIMGNEKGSSTHKPTHNVYIKEFSISQSLVNIKQWNACYADGFCTKQAKDEGNGRAQNPLTNISYDETLGFVNWLKSLSGNNYQLVSEAQWEYVARLSVQENRYQLINSPPLINEILQDCWHPNYLGAPSDGKPWKANDCQNVVTRTSILKKGNYSFSSRTKISRKESKKTRGFRVAITQN